VGLPHLAPATTSWQSSRTYRARTATATAAIQYYMSGRVQTAYVDRHTPRWWRRAVARACRFPSSPTTAAPALPPRLPCPSPSAKNPPTSALFPHLPALRALLGGGGRKPVLAAPARVGCRREQTNRTCGGRLPALATTACFTRHCPPTLLPPAVFGSSLFRTGWHSSGFSAATLALCARWKVQLGGAGGGREDLPGTPPHAMPPPLTSTPALNIPAACIAGYRLRLPPCGAASASCYSAAGCSDTAAPRWRVKHHADYLRRASLTDLPLRYAYLSPPLPAVLAVGALYAMVACQRFTHTALPHPTPAWHRAHGHLALFFAATTKPDHFCPWQRRTTDVAGRAEHRARMGLQAFLRRATVRITSRAGCGTFLCHTCHIRHAVLLHYNKPSCRSLPCPTLRTLSVLLAAGQDGQRPALRAPAPRPHLYLA